MHTSVIIQDLSQSLKFGRRSILTKSKTYVYWYFIYIALLAKLIMLLKYIIAIYHTRLRPSNYQVQSIYCRRV